MKDNTTTTDDAWRDVLEARREVCACAEELRELEDCYPPPWWHRAGKVAALLLLANGLAMVWVGAIGLVPTERAVPYIGFAVFSFLFSAAVGVTSDHDR